MVQQTKDDFSAIAVSAAVAQHASPEARELAKKEAKVLEDGSARVRREVHGLAIWALRTGFVILLILILIRVWHLVGPSCWRWLSDNETQTIDKMLFSSAFGGIVLGYLKEIMKPIQPE